MDFINLDSNGSALDIIDLESKELAAAKKKLTVFADPDHASETMKRLNVLRKNRQLCDLIIQIEAYNRDIYCHQLVLACHSKLFMEMFLNIEIENSKDDTSSTDDEQPDTDSQQLHRKNSLNNKQNANKQILFSLSNYVDNINEHTYEALKSCINFMYTSRLEVSSLSLIEHCYHLCHRLSFEHLTHVLSKYLIEHLDESNCLRVRSFALDDSLIRESSAFIETHLEKVVLTKQFIQLPRINIELIGNKREFFSDPVVSQLLLKWIDKYMRSEGAPYDIDTLINNVNMLYLNESDKALHDCFDMDATNEFYSEYVSDYQKSRHPSIAPVSGTVLNGVNKATAAKLACLKITHQELNEFLEMPLRTPPTPHDNEIICTYKSGDHAFITLCMIDRRMVTLNAHIRLGAAAANDRNNNLSKSDSSENCVGDSSPSTSASSTTSLNGADAGQVSPLCDPVPVTSGHSNGKLAKMNLARCSHGLVAVDGLLYIIGGYDRGECLNKCEFYEPVSNSFGEMSAMTCRRGRAATVWHPSTKRIYVLGGSDGHQELNSLEYYAFDERKWHQKVFDYELQCTNVGAIVAGVDGSDEFIYLIGVRDKNAIQRHCLKYDPVNDQFSRIASLNAGRSQCALVRHRENLYVFGGHDQIRCLNSCETFSLKENTWTPIASMIEPRRGCGAAEKDGLVYLVGGTNGSCSLKSMEIYNITTNRFTIGPELNTPRANVAIAFVGNYLFAVGGFDGKNFLRTIEYLDCDDMNCGWRIYHEGLCFDEERLANGTL